MSRDPAVHEDSPGGPFPPGLRRSQSGDGDSQGRKRSAVTVSFRCQPPLPPPPGPPLPFLKAFLDSVKTTPPALGEPPAEGSRHAQLVPTPRLETSGLGVGGGRFPQLP